MLGSRHVILVPILHVLHLREPEATSWRQRWTRWSHSTGLETSGTGAKTPMGKTSFQGGWTWITPPGRVDVMFLGVGKKKQHLVVVNEFRNFWFPSLVKNRNSFGYFQGLYIQIGQVCWDFFPRSWDHRLSRDVTEILVRSCCSEWFVTVFHDFEESGSLLLNCFFKDQLYHLLIDHQNQSQVLFGTKYDNDLGSQMTPESNGPRPVV